jgi:hypothetical protein
MALIPQPDVHGYTIFCDDIREEVGGKHSLMGAYGGLMIINVPFPVTLPTFAFAVTVLQRRKIFNPSVAIWVFLPGDSGDEPSIQGEFGEVAQGTIASATSAATEALHPDARAPYEDQYIILSTNMKFSPLIMKQPGVVKVRAIIGDNMYRIGAMSVSPPPDANASQPPS